MNLPADKIPTDAPSFLKWADAACPQWPGELQVLAYRAWQWLEGMKFRTAAERRQRLDRHVQAVVEINQVLATYQ
jgi:hypothetical protein